MATAKKAAKKAVAKKAAQPDKTASIKTISELNKLSDEEKQAFREAGGTTIQG